MLFEGDITPLENFLEDIKKDPTAIERGLRMPTKFVIIPKEKAQRMLKLQKAIDDYTGTDQETSPRIFF